MIKTTLVCGIQALESRCMMSVSIPASTFVGPLKVGDTFNFGQFVGGKQTAIETIKVIGNAKFNGVSCIERDTTTTSATRKFVSKNYFTDNSTGVHSLGSVDTLTFKGKTTITTYTRTPAALFVPAHVVAGQAYTDKFTEKAITTLNGKVISSSSQQVTVVSKLLSASTTTLRLPAGSFKVYEVDSTRTTGSGATKSTTTGKDFFAAGIGLVEVVSGTGSTQVATELTSYKI